MVQNLLSLITPLSLFCRKSSTVTLTIGDSQSFSWMTFSALMLQYPQLRSRYQRRNGHQSQCGNGNRSTVPVGYTQRIKQELGCNNPIFSPGIEVLVFEPALKKRFFNLRIISELNEFNNGQALLWLTALRRGWKT